MTWWGHAFYECDLVYCAVFDVWTQGTCYACRTRSRMCFIVCSPSSAPNEYNTPQPAPPTPSRSIPSWIQKYHWARSSCRCFRNLRTRLHVVILSNNNFQLMTATFLVDSSSVSVLGHKKVLLYFWNCVFSCVHKTIMASIKETI